MARKSVVTILRIVMPLVALVCVVVFPPWNGILAWLAPLPETVQEQLDDAVERGLDGIIVYVDRGGRSPAHYAAGWKDRIRRIPADPHALFKIASISKLYIAAAAAKLAHSGRLDLNRTLAEYLPEVADRIQHADRITVRMLLQHRSGIPNFTDDPAFNWFVPWTDIHKALELVLDDPADFEPGTRYRYSNTNYLLVGMILDQVLGHPHQEYIRRELLQPLSLTRTFASLAEVDLDELMSGYHHGVDADLKELEYAIPGGSMVATAQDVGVFLRSLVGGRLLSKGEQAVYNTVYVYEHTGWLPGYYSIARYHRDIDAVVVEFVGNTGDSEELTSNVVYDRVVEILRRERSPEAQVTGVSPRDRRAISRR
ncbi:MAG: hypothetical protein Kow00109_24570 [Acidobacteriota bacterium]